MSILKCRRALIDVLQQLFDEGFVVGSGIALNGGGFTVDAIEAGDAGAVDKVASVLEGMEGKMAT